MFHKDMTTSNTWLSNTESRVAELDSRVEACHAEDSGDMKGIKDEMNVCVEVFILSPALKG